MKGKNKQLSYEFGKRNSQIKYSFFNIINLKTNYQKNIQKKLEGNTNTQKDNIKY